MTKKDAKTQLIKKAFDYLSRYSSSSHKLQRILQRFAIRKLPNDDPEEIRKTIHEILELCIKLGYLNDQNFALTFAQSQRRMGRSQAMIRSRLRQHALTDDIIKHALTEADENSANGDLLAAIRFAKRRCFGPFAKRKTSLSHEPEANKSRERELRAMARAGFSLTTSLKVLKYDDPESIDRLLI